MFSLCGRKIQVNDRQEVNNRRRFKSETVGPLAEGIRGNGFSGLKRAVAGVMLGLTLATGVMTGFSGCNCNGSKIEQPAEDQLKGYATTTNNEGKAAFQVNDRKYEFNAVDVETQQPISNLLVILALKGEDALYIVIDPSSNYPTRFIQASQELLQSPSGLRRAQSQPELVTNVVFQKKIEDCLIGHKHDLLNYKTPEQLFKDKGFRDQYFEKQRETVKLKDLNNVLLQLVQVAYNNRVTDTVSTALGASLGPAGIPATLYFAYADLCAVNESLNWAAHYRSMCYSDEAEFEIYKLKGIPDLSVHVDMTNVGPIDLGVFNNPIFVILPVNPPQSWTSVPSIEVVGQVVNEETETPNKWAYIELKNVGGSIPTIGTFVNENGRFHFAGTACNSPSYTLTSFLFDNIGQPYVTATSDEFTATPPYEFYEMNYRLKRPEFCSTGYHTFYYDAEVDGVGGKFKFTVSCSKPASHVENKDDCDDTNSRKNLLIGGQCIQTTCPATSSLFYPDRDRDGLGDSKSTPTSFCPESQAPAGFVANAEDCDDNDGNVGRRAERTVSCNNGRGSQTDTCERGAWFFGDCRPLTDGEPDGGVGRADGGSDGTVGFNAACSQDIENLYGIREFSLSVYDRTVVYAQEYGLNNIYYIDVCSGEVHRITSAEGVQGILPRIEGNKIVFQMAIGDYYNLAVYDMRTGVLESMGAGWAHSVSNGRVGFVSDESIYSIYDLNNRELTRITLPQDMQFREPYNYPVLFESGVAMQNSETATIVFYDFESGNWRTIETTGFEVYDFQLSCQGTRCAFWSRSSNGSSKIYWTNLLSGETQEVYGGNYPKIWGNNIVFHSWNFSTQNGTDLAVYNIATGQLTNLTQTPSELEAQSAIHGTSAAYLVVQYGESKVYYGTLSE